MSKQVGAEEIHHSPRDIGNDETPAEGAVVVGVT